MTPYGIRAHLPCIDVLKGTGFVLVDIFCHSTHPQAQRDNRILLLLQRNVPANEDPTGYPCYGCQWLETLTTRHSPGTRIVHITEAGTTPRNQRSLAQWRDIYISARPRHRAHLRSDISELIARLATNAPKFPSFRLQPSMVSGQFYYCCAVTQLRPSSPWIGDRPCSLIIEMKPVPSNHHTRSRWIVTLGVCNGINKVTTATSNPPSHAVQRYAIVTTIRRWDEEARILEVSSGTYKPPEHNCQKDHVSNGSIITREFLGHRFKMSFRKSMVDAPGDTLEVHMGGPVSRQYYVNLGAYDGGLTFR